ncbi:MAG: hypothetical protein P8R45_10815, partial [Candidatus Binatia bacterium]|nr:hypothetical protein [Candidatus Binatia bacterium]
MDEERGCLIVVNFWTGFLTGPATTSNQNQRGKSEKKRMFNSIEFSGSSGLSKLKFPFLARSSQTAGKRDVSRRFAIPRGAIGARPTA